MSLSNSEISMITGDPASSLITITSTTFNYIYLYLAIDFQVIFPNILALIVKQSMRFLAPSNPFCIIIFVKYRMKEDHLYLRTYLRYMGINIWRCFEIFAGAHYIFFEILAIRFCSFYIEKPKKIKKES